MAKKWTSDDEKYLAKNYGKIGNKELAAHFGVTPKAVANKMSSLRMSGVVAPAESKPVAKKAAPSPKVKKAKSFPSTPAKKKKPKAARTSIADQKKEPEGPPEYIPTTIMIMTEEGWKPIKIDKRKIES